MKMMPIVALSLLFAAGCSSTPTGLLASGHVSQFRIPTYDANGVLMSDIQGMSAEFVSPTRVLATNVTINYYSDSGTVTNTESYRSISLVNGVIESGIPADDETL